VARRAEQARVYAAGAFGDFVVLDSLREKRGIVTANPTTPYIVGWVDLADGPVVIDYPAGETSGGVLDCWRRPVADLGLTGPDRGRGARYVIVAPGDDPAQCGTRDAFVIHSTADAVFIGLRLLSATLRAAAALKSEMRMPRAGRAPHPGRLIEGLDRDWSATPPRGLIFRERRAEVLATEPVREVDRVMMAMLEPLGIAPGRAFATDARHARILADAAALGELAGPQHSRPALHARTGPTPAGTKASIWRSTRKPTSSCRSTSGPPGVTRPWRAPKAVSPAPGTGQVCMTTAAGVCCARMRSTACACQDPSRCGSRGVSPSIARRPAARRTTAATVRAASVSTVGTS
jgi:hypothetical protein